MGLSVCAPTMRKPEMRFPSGITNAKRLELFWSADPTTKRYVDVEHASRSQTPYRYGLSIDVDQVSLLKW